MEIKTIAGLIEDIDHIRLFRIRVNDYNYIKVKKKLESEIDKSLAILYDLKNQKKIKSVSLPRNEEIQEKLNLLVKFKQTLKESLEKIESIF